MRSACLALTALVLVACGPTNAQTPRGPDPRRTGTTAQRAAVMPHETCAGSGGDVQRDTNGDGRVDIREVHRGGRLFCRESDPDFDGRADTTRWFDEQGRPTRIEDDFDFDGRIDIVSTYRDGQIVSDLLDSNFDGRVDTWREYRNGQLVARRIDTNNDGRADMWDAFDETGRIVRTSVDADGDGQPDRARGADRDGGASSSGSSGGPSEGAGS